MRTLLVWMVVPALAAAEPAKPAPAKPAPAKPAPAKPAPAKPAPDGAGAPAPGLSGPSSKPGARKKLTGPVVPTVMVELAIKPVIGDKVPTLTVTLENPNKVAVPLTRFAEPVCFAHHYLVIALTGPGGKPVNPSTPGCAIRDWPGSDEKIAGGASATIEVPLTALFGALPKGRYEIDVDWNPAELEKVRPGTGVRASQTSSSGSTFVIAKPLSTFKILRGKSVNLPGGHKLTFRAHGHKHMMAGGPPSPLIIRGEIAIARKKPVEFDENVQVERDRVFQVEGLTFELGTYEYDGFMELRYYGPIVLE